MHKGAILQETELLRIPDRHGSAENLTYDEKPSRGQGQLRSWAGSWRLVVFLSFLASLVVLCLNLGFLIWAATRTQVHKSRGILYEGDCDKVQRLNVGLHFLINVLATAVLAGSNYTMVCTTPGRKADLTSPAMSVGAHEMRRRSSTPQWPLAGHRRAEHSQSGACICQTLSAMGRSGLDGASSSSAVRIPIVCRTQLIVTVTTRLFSRLGPLMHIMYSLERARVSDRENSTPRR